MKHMLLTFAALAIITSIAYFTLTHPNHKEVDRLQHEYSRLEQRNQTMKQENLDLEQQVIALRDDPRLAEKKARQAGGLAKPHELIYKFENPNKKDLSMEVKLKVSPSKVELAGKQVSLKDLPTALDQLAQQIPDAHLKVVFDDALGPIARQRIQDILQQSPIQSIDSQETPSK